MKFRSSQHSLNSLTKETVQFIKSHIPKAKNKFTPEEDQKLLSLTEKYKERNWKKIASYFPNKNYIQCFSRYKRIKPGIKRGAWTKEEDSQILFYFQMFGKQWAKIAKQIKTRNGKQIRDRYINVLDPKINKEIFTYKEDLCIVQCYQLYGPQWSKIAKECGTCRTPDIIKNRFYSHLKNKLNNFLCYNSCVKNELNRNDTEINLPNTTEESDEFLGDKISTNSVYNGSNSDSTGNDCVYYSDKENNINNNSHIFFNENDEYKNCDDNITDYLGENCDVLFNDENIFPQ